MRVLRLGQDRARAAHEVDGFVDRKSGPKDGDLVQFDYAPDYKYYQSDVTRVFPANGTFTARQREFYTIYLRLYQALMTSITVHAAPHDVIVKAVGKMDAVMAAFRFTDPKIKAAATTFIENYRKCTTSARRPRRSSPARSSRSNRRCRSPTSTSASASRT